LAELAQKARGILVVEMNAGQMLEDVRLAVNGHVPVKFFGRMGGVVPLPDEVLAAIRQMTEGKEHIPHPSPVSCLPMYGGL
jgi:2-oxoglutarate ferredoxin oxidoreductase subunit alpha